MLRVFVKENGIVFNRSTFLPHLLQMLYSLFIVCHCIVLLSPFFIFTEKVRKKKGGLRAALGGRVRAFSPSA